MPNAPNRVDLVRELAAQFPQEFKDCHRPERGERAWAFIKRVAWRLYQEDKNFGLNGKRGTNELSYDAVSYKTPHTIGEGGVEIIDVVKAAGGDNPEPVWSDVTERGVAGKWIEPAPVDGQAPQPSRPSPAPSVREVPFPPRDIQREDFNWIQYEQYSWSKADGTAPAPDTPGVRPEILAKDAHGGEVPHPIDDEGRIVWMGRYFQLMLRWPNQRQRVKERLHLEIQAAFHKTDVPPLDPR